MFPIVKLPQQTKQKTTQGIKSMIIKQWLCLLYEQRKTFIFEKKKPHTHKKTIKAVIWRGIWDAPHPSPFITFFASTSPMQNKKTLPNGGTIFGMLSSTQKVTVFQISCFESQLMKAFDHERNVPVFYQCVINFVSNHPFWWNNLPSFLMRIAFTYP